MKNTIERGSFVRNLKNNNFGFINILRLDSTELFYPYKMFLN